MSLLEEEYLRYSRGGRCPVYCGSEPVDEDLLHENYPTVLLDSDISLYGNPLDIKRLPLPSWLHSNFLMTLEIILRDDPERSEEYDICDQSAYDILDNFSLLVFEDDCREC